MKLFTITCERDLIWLKWAFRSVYKFCDEQVVWHVVTDNQTCDAVKRLADECAQYGNPRGNTIIVHGLHAWPETANIQNGHMMQNWIKLTANRVVGDDLVWNWDSDVCALKHFTEADFLGKNGAPINWFSEIDRLKSCENGAIGMTFYDVFCQRARLLETIFGCKVTREWMRCMPIPLIGSILRAGAQTPIWEKSYKECAAGNRLLSEFNVIAQFAYLNFNDSFEWKDEDTQGPTWGEFHSSFFSRSCGNAGIVCQYFSCEGETPKFKAWIQKEFGNR